MRAHEAAAAMLEKAPTSSTLRTPASCSEGELRRRPPWMARPSAAALGRRIAVRLAGHGAEHATRLWSRAGRRHCTGRGADAACGPESALALPQSEARGRGRWRCRGYEGVRRFTRDPRARQARRRDRSAHMGARRLSCGLYRQGPRGTRSAACSGEHRAPSNHSHQSQADRGQEIGIARHRDRLGRCGCRSDIRHPG